jgi:hypothetical protein
MLIEGSKVLALARPEVWRALNDPGFLQRVIPGCREVSEPTPGKLLMALTSAVGPIKVNFDVDVQKRDVVEPESFVLEGKGSGGVAGSATGRVHVRLRELEGGTQLDYAAQTEITGRIAQLGSRMINSTARKFSEEFFANVAAAMQRQQGTSANTTGTTSVPGTAAASPQAPAPSGGAPHAADPHVWRLLVDGVIWRVALGCAVGSFVGTALALALRAI